MKTVNYHESCHKFTTQNTNGVPFHNTQEKRYHCRHILCVVWKKTCLIFFRSTTFKITFGLTHNSERSLLFVRNRRPPRHLAVFREILTSRTFSASIEAFSFSYCHFCITNLSSHKQMKNLNLEGKIVGLIYHFTCTFSILFYVCTFPDTFILRISQL